MNKNFYAWFVDITGIRAQSLDPRGGRREAQMDLKFDDPSCKTPVLCNQYAIDELDNIQNGKIQNIRSQSMPRQQTKYAGGNERDRYAHDRSMQPSHVVPVHSQYRHKSEQHDLYRQPEDDIEMIPVKKHRRRERHGKTMLC